MRWAWYVACTGKRPLRRPRHKWENNIKVDLKETGCELDSSGSGDGPVADSCEHNNQPLGSIKLGNFLSKSLSTFQGLWSMEW